MNQRTIAFLSSYPPTKCGLATFSAALREHLADHATQIGVVRVLNDQISKPELPEVVEHLVTGSRSSVAAALARLNTFDAVVIQHEYGIFGGIDGVDVLEYAAGLKVPVVVVMHTVLSSPTPLQRGILVELARSANMVITMSETARTRLIHLYGIPAEHVTVIPHGATDYRNAALSAPSHKDRPLILTWGLLGPGKGIEWAIDAMPALRGFNPRYLVTGQTHPDGLFRNRRGQSGEWRGPAESGDCWGRAIWALGDTATRHSDSRVREVALAVFDRSVRWRSPSRRAMAYGTLGAAAVLSVYPGHQGAKAFLSATVRRIVPREDEAWLWPKERLSYANALLPEALLAAGTVLPDSKAQRDGLHLLDWLADIETSGNHLSVTPVRGCDGLTATGRNENQGAESTLALIATRQNARLCLAVIA